MGQEIVSSASNMSLYFLAIFLPPLTVFMKRGCGADFWINVCLWILGWVPGVLHAWDIISRSEEPVIHHAWHARGGRSRRFYSNSEYWY
ncbi:hypothetical protein CPB84DRAFT_1767086 [Gymnopilus junonius]|uniref:Plasma membrane proteolipid 3 n=1 Tax=Gymnopilus junonius TaxID=109634 RepID=A0A9P5NTJ9_GYMJU|nr:hypothetical protein CPB84DRAFT_1767086 [Gymnopilus junonius]